MNDNFNHSIVHIEEVIAETYPIATIRQKPSEIKKIIEIEFTEAYDDLDYLVFAILDLPSANRVGLVSHQHSPDLGTEICVSYELLNETGCDTKMNVTEIIKDTLIKLSLSSKDLNWVHPDYEQKLHQSESFKTLLKG